jgi:hypothetical protein
LSGLLVWSVCRVEDLGGAVDAVGLEQRARIGPWVATVEAERVALAGVDWGGEGPPAWGVLGWIGGAEAIGMRSPSRITSTREAFGAQTEMCS